MKIFNPTVSGSIILPTGSAPVTSSGFAYIYAKTDGKIYLTQENGTESQVGGGGSSVTAYTVTTADAENTTDEITILSFTVPGNTWLDGEVVWINPVMGGLSPSGFPSSNTTIKIEATGLTTVSGSVYPPTSVGGGNGPGYNIYRGPVYFRIGNDLWSLSSFGNGVSKNGLLSPNFAGSNPSLPAQSTFTITTNYDFTQNFVFSYKAKHASAASNYYIRVLKAYANKSKISEVTF